MPPDSGRWSEYRRLVLHELERFQEWLGTLTDRQASLDTDLHQALSDTKEELSNKISMSKGALENDIKKLREEIASLKTELAVQKIKVGIWGLIAGAIPVGIAIALKIWFG